MISGKHPVLKENQNRIHPVVCLEDKTFFLAVCLKVNTFQAERDMYSTAYIMRP